MIFGQAIEALKAGKKVSRAGWNGKGMWLSLVTDCNAFGPQFEDGQTWISPYIVMKTADNKFVPWLASQTDVLAEDWGIIE